MHPVSPTECQECHDLARLDGLDLRKIIEVEHRSSYSILRLRVLPGNEYRRPTTLAALDPHRLGVIVEDHGLPLISWGRP